MTTIRNSLRNTFKNVLHSPTFHRTQGDILKKQKSMNISSSQQGERLDIGNILSQNTERFPASHPVFASTYHRLGEIYDRYKQPFLAFQLQKTAEHFSRSDGGIENPKYTTLYHDLAKGYLNMGKPQKAISLLKELISTCDKHEDEDNLIYPSIYTHLSEGYHALAAKAEGENSPDMAAENHLKELKCLQKAAYYYRLHQYDSFRKPEGPLSLIEAKIEKCQEKIKSNPPPFWRQYFKNAQGEEKPQDPPRNNGIS